MACYDIVKNDIFCKFYGRVVELGHKVWVLTVEQGNERTVLTYEELAGGVNRFELIKRVELDKLVGYTGVLKALIDKTVEKKLYLVNVEVRATFMCVVYSSVL